MMSYSSDAILTLGRESAKAQEFGLSEWVSDNPFVCVVYV